FGADIELVAVSHPGNADARVNADILDLLAHCSTPLKVFLPTRALHTMATGIQAYLFSGTTVPARIRLRGGPRSSSPANLRKQPYTDCLNARYRRRSTRSIGHKTLPKS